MASRKGVLRTKISKLDVVISALSGVTDGRVIAIREKRFLERQSLSEQLRALKPLKAQMAAATAARDRAIRAVSVLRRDICALEALLQMKAVQLTSAEQDAQPKTTTVETLVIT